jgi:hypothetical protein
MTNTETTATPAPRIEGYIILTRDQRWGWGQSIDEAKRAAKRAGAGSVAKANIGIYRLPVGARDAYVDQMGRVCWDWAEDVPSLDDSDARRQTGDWLHTPIA